MAHTDCNFSQLWMFFAPGSFLSVLQDHQSLQLLHVSPFLLHVIFFLPCGNITYMYNISEGCRGSPSLLQIFFTDYFRREESISKEKIKEIAHRCTEALRHYSSIYNCRVRREEGTFIFKLSRMQHFSSSCFYKSVRVAVATFVVQMFSIFCLFYEAVPQLWQFLLQLYIHVKSICVAGCRIYPKGDIADRKTGNGHEQLLFPTRRDNMMSSNPLTLLVIYPPY